VRRSDRQCRIDSHETVIGRRDRARGFTYIGLLIGIAIMGAVLASTGILWHTHVQREREAELLFVGEQFQRAIGNYFERSPEAAKTYPRTLEDLLEDRRSGSVVRHLRKIFVDPMTGKAEWGLITQPDGRVVGVFSLSPTPILRTANLPEGLAVRGEKHSDWKFMGNVPAKIVTVAGVTAVRGAGSPGTPAAASPAPAPGISPTPDALVAPPEEPPNDCAEMRRTDMLKCSELPEAARPKCESASARSYAICVRDAARRR
jgi:type II secretory pathway pseudopilin PulG